MGSPNEKNNPGKRRDAYGAYYFSVEINGIESAFFRSVSGLKSESEVVPIQEGGVNTYEHKLIGRTKYPNIVLKQGFADASLWHWRQCFVTDASDGTLSESQNAIKSFFGQSKGIAKGLKDLSGNKPTRFNGTITQYGPGGKKAHKWQFIDGWICKWEGPEFDASKNEISLESIEIAHHGLKYEKGT